MHEVTTIQPPARRLARIAATMIFFLLACGMAWWAVKGLDTSGEASPVAASQGDFPATSRPGDSSGDQTERNPLPASQPETDWHLIVSRWLFDSVGGFLGSEVSKAIVDGGITTDFAAQIVLDLVVEDAAAATPRLCRHLDVAVLLTGIREPCSEVVAAAMAYKRLHVRQEHHERLQALLADWPCFDPASCRDAFAAALRTLPDDAVWSLLRERLLRNGAVALAEIAGASLDLARGQQPPVARLSLVMEAFYSFSDSPDAVTAVLQGKMEVLGEETWAQSQAGNAAAAREFGVYGPSMSAWAAALRSCLTGEPRHPDAVSKDARRAILAGIFENPWPGDRASANAFHRMLLSLADGSDVPAASAYLKRAAVHATMPGTRMGAFAKLGMTQTVESLEITFGEMVAANPTAIHDSNLRIGFYAAVDNARVLQPGSLAEAIRVFADCLAEQAASAAPYQLFVLEALARNPIPELAWAVEQVRHHPGKRQVAEQAARTLQNLRR